MQAVNERVRTNMHLNRIDLYSGYVGGPKPNSDNRFIWAQGEIETDEDYIERLQNYIQVIVTDNRTQWESEGDYDDE